jgi:predicted AAA+ superfamily ATPase
LFRHLKVAVDANRTRNGQFLLTGSQKFTMMKDVSESLAGRADIVELETLSFAEIQAALPQTGIETAIVHGGFPELYANPDIDSVAFYNSYLATYLERDVRSLANVSSLRDFERFLRACALRSANLLNKADLARDRWLMGTHQGAVSHKHLDYYLDEFTFRFNRRRSKSRGKLFFRLAQQAVAVDPVTHHRIVHPTSAKAKAKPQM